MIPILAALRVGLGNQTNNDTRIPTRRLRPRQRHCRHLPRSQRRGICRPQLRARHHAARRFSEQQRAARSSARPRSQPRQRRLGREFGDRSLAARRQGRRSSAALATIAMASTTPRNSSNSASTSALPIIVNETTGTCVCLITPDAERTMRTCLAVSSHLADKHVDAERIKSREWLFIEGYVFANPDTGQAAIREAINRQEARHRRSPSLVRTRSLSMFSATRSSRRSPRPTCSSAMRRKRVPSPRRKSAGDAFEKLKKMVPSAVVTDGPNGAFVRHAGTEAHVAAFPCEPTRFDRRRRHVCRAFLYGDHARVPGSEGGASGELPGDESDHSGRRPAAPWDEGRIGAGSRRGIRRTRWPGSHIYRRQSGRLGQG